jgi:hypothetical protein
MSENLAKIKITDTKIIITRKETIETFSIKDGDDKNYISYRGKIYKFVNEKNI